VSARKGDGRCDDPDDQEGEGEIAQQEADRRRHDPPSSEADAWMAREIVDLRFPLLAA
jgi:hypothetical protein